MIKRGEKYTKLNGSFVKIVADRAHDAAKGINDYYVYAVYDTGVASEDDKDVNFIGVFWEMHMMMENID